MEGEIGEMGRCAAGADIAERLAAMGEESAN